MCIGSRRLFHQSGDVEGRTEADVVGWLAQESGAGIKERAARAYHKYQECGLTLFYADD